MSRITRHLTAAFLGAVLVSLSFSPVAAKILMEERLIAYKDPTGIRMRCTKWERPFGIKTCVGYRTQIRHRTVYFVLDGPPPSKAALRVLEDAFEAAVAAGLAAAAATPGEAAIKTSAGIAAAKITFPTYLASVGAAKFISQYDVMLRPKDKWVRL